MKKSSQHAGVASDDVNERLARVEDVYKRDRSDQLQGLPSLAEEFNWTDDEVKDFKKLLFKITGRDALPEYTNTFRRTNCLHDEAKEILRSRRQRDV